MAIREPDFPVMRTLTGRARPPEAGSCSSACVAPMLLLAAALQRAEAERDEARHQLANVLEDRAQDARVVDAVGELVTAVHDEELPLAFSADPALLLLHIERLASLDDVRRAAATDQFIAGLHRLRDDPAGSILSAVAEGVWWTPCPSRPWPRAPRTGSTAADRLPTP